ncbi:MAG: TetR/AcrR family transcriptional regulator [Rhizobiaceae bacterium]
MSRDKFDTRTRILKTTQRLLEAGSSNSVRMSDIAKACGVSRQAVYLHFPTRAELLVATARSIDEAENIDLRLTASRTALGGVDRLSAFIEAWGNYIPAVFGVAKALQDMKDNDPEAKAAWDDRMRALRHGCQAAVNAIVKDGLLNPQFRKKEAVDFLLTLISVKNWEHLTKECGWSQRQYINSIRHAAESSLIKSR